MTHDTWTDRLSEYLDGDLTHAERGAAEAHLIGCAACRTTLMELRAVRGRARQLPNRPPAADLWPAIRQAIGSSAPSTVAGSGASPDARPVESASVRPLRTRRRYVFSLPQLAAAGIALAAVSGTGVWLARGGAEPMPGAPVASAPAATSPVINTSTPLREASLRAEATYDAAINDLQAVLEAGRASLDPSTVAVLEENLAIIDTAIAEAQQAIANDPANTYLNAHLARTMQRKLDLMRRAAALAAPRS